MNQTAFIQKRCEMLNREECDNALDRVDRFCSWFSPFISIRQYK